MKTFRYIGILVGILAFQSCSDFLEIDPESGIAPDNFFQNERDAKRALVGVYDILGMGKTYGIYFWYEFGVGTDNSVINRSYVTSGVTLNNYTAGESTIAEAWEAVYDGINRTNLFLEKVPAIDMNEEQKQRMLGEVRFIRGLLYFNLARFWGGVPILLESTKSVEDVKIARASLAEVYAQVIEDMEFAEKVVFPASRFHESENGRVCKGAVQGVLARVNLFMAGEPLRDQTRYQHALDWAQKVKDSGEHSLLTNQKQVFDNLIQDIFDMRESMFEIVFYGNRTGDAEAMSFGGINSIQSQSVEYGYSYAFLNSTKKLYDLYEPTDIRRDIAVATFMVKKDGSKTFYKDDDIVNRKPGKWDRGLSVVDPKNKNFTSTNFPVIRYADVLLMLAEAENEINGPTQKAFNALNAVRTRDESLTANNTGATLFTNIDLPDKEAFRNAIIDERARELCHEGKRKMDLIRWGIYISTLKNLAAQIKAEYPSNRQYMARVGENVEDRHLLLPIPVKEIEMNPALKQNPGW